MHQAAPLRRIRRNKPFGTAPMIETMRGKLPLHSAISGNFDRMKMCADRRVVDMMSNTKEAVITEGRRDH